MDGRLVRLGLVIGLVWGLALMVPPPSAEAGEPTYAELVGKAVAARKAGDLDAAAAALEKARALKPSPELSNNLGRVYEEMGQYAKAYDIYLAVSNDPLADRSLRALDSGRMAALQPKIGVAWVLPKIAPEGTSITVDNTLLEGRALTMEQATGPGRSGLEFLAPGATEVVVRVLKFPVGERTIYEEDLGKPGESDATLTFAGVLPVGEVRLNGHRIKTDLGTVPVCRISAGPVVLDIRRPGMKKEVHELELGEGVELEITEILRSEPLPVGTVIAQPWRPSRAPWIVGGSGGVATLVGTGLLFSASAAQQDLADHTEGTDVVGLSHPEAQDLNDRANTHGTLGSVLLSSGIAALVGGAIWYLFDQMDAPPEGSEDRASNDASPTTPEPFVPHTPTPAYGVTR